jgi:hypothetical protein
MSKVTVSDLVPNYSKKHFDEATAIMQELHEDTMAYASLDNLYDLETMERLKRSMVGHLEFLGEHYARVKKFKTIGDYLEETRKSIKAEAIDLIVNEEGLSVNQAEKVVYNNEFYKERVEAMQQLKAFFIKVEVMYERYTDVLNNIRQSLSLVRKDPNFKPPEDE